MIESKGCSTCVFFKKKREDENGVYGICRRFPPVLSMLSKKEKDKAEWDDGVWLGRYESSFAAWWQPAVYDCDWCGEYKELNVDKLDDAAKAVIAMECDRVNAGSQSEPYDPIANPGQFDPRVVALAQALMRDGV